VLYSHRRCAALLLNLFDSNDRRTSSEQNTYYRDLFFSSHSTAVAMCILKKIDFPEKQVTEKMHLMQ